MAETHAPWQVLHPTQQTRPAPPKTHCSVGSLPMLLLKLLAMMCVLETLLQYLMARMLQCCCAMLKGKSLSKHLSSDTRATSRTGQTEVARALTQREGSNIPARDYCFPWVF